MTWVRITVDVDGLKAGELHDLRDGYAKALVSANKAVYETPPTQTRKVPLASLEWADSVGTFVCDESHVIDDTKQEDVDDED